MPTELWNDSALSVFCTLLKKKDWHSRLDGGIHTNAIVDRIAHDAI